MGIEAKDGPHWHYPALVGCIQQARRGRPAEVRRVATRILADILRQADGLRPVASFTERRQAILAARAALNGYRRQH